MNKAIVLGSDAVNALGLVQSLGREGVYVIAVLDCKESVLISKSKYAKEIVNVTNFEQGIDIISEKYLFEEPAVIFPAGDGAALAIEKSSSRLRGKFLFEHIVGEKGFEFYMQKQNQISIAREFNLNVPISIRVQKGGEAPDKMVYPCIVKPLVSCEGDKRDIHIAEDKAELNEILKNKINFSSEVIVQQYIDKDYEYDIMGCAYKNHEIYIPLSNRMVKFNRNLQDTSTVSYIEPLDSEIAIEVLKIKKLLAEIGYVGLFSVEFMHCKSDDKIYFTEINFRNDGENSFIVHCGVNLPFLHYQDLCGFEKKNYSPITKSKKYIWEGIHFSGLIKKDQSFMNWLSDFKGVDGFLYYFKDDKKPFFYQFANKLLERLRFKK